MPRLPVVDPATATGPVKEIFDGPLKGMHINLFKGMANSPTGLKAYLGLAEALAAGSLSDKEKETIALVIGEANSCDYCVAAHTMLGKKAGLTEDQTVAARKGELSDDAKLAELVNFTRAIVEKKGFVDEADVDAFKSVGYSDANIVEVVVTFTLNTYTNYFNHLNATEVDFPAVPALA
ncbi:MAG: carboxymuconolactone decarboxylase family protein [Planctomycetota bacterium]